MYVFQIKWQQRGVSLWNTSHQIFHFFQKKCLITCMGHESQNGKENLQETLEFEAKGEMFQLFFPMNIMNQSNSMVRSCQIYNSNKLSSLAMENGSFIGDLRVNPWFLYGKPWFPPRFPHGKSAALCLGQILHPPSQAALHEVLLDLGQHGAGLRWGKNHGETMAEFDWVYVRYNMI